MTYGWYIRNSRSGLFVALGAERGHEHFQVGRCLMRWVRHRRDALRFDTWEAGRDFLARLDAQGPLPPGWHLIDYRECDLSTRPDAGPPRVVRTAEQVRSDTLAEDRIREAVRRAHWTIKPALALYALAVTALEQSAETILRGGS